jgi:hypothetical protein
LIFLQSVLIFLQLDFFCPHLALPAISLRMQSCDRRFDVQQYLTREESAAYLSAKGLKITKTTLQKLATVGGGPEYVIFGNRALSAPEWLDRWPSRNLSRGARPARRRNYLASLLCFAPTNKAVPGT